MAESHDTIEAIGSDLELPPIKPTIGALPDGVTFTRRKGRYRLATQHMLKNSLLAGVGYLELANAGDFAANVWNEVPVPVFAVVLMAIGGSLALGLSVFALKDAELSWRNITVLRKERRYLDTQHAGREQQTRIARDIDSQLNVNFRELGTELIDRIGMDIVMGIGAVVVGVATFMAIDGADPTVFLASNLMSGYIGNAPVAFYGLANVAWSAYVWRRAHRHGIAGEKELGEGVVKEALKSRLRSVEIHAAVNGVSGVFAGAASLVTATMWYGYPVLLGCIISAVLCNYFFRHKIAYDRPLVQKISRVDKSSLIEELEFVIAAQRILAEAPTGSLPSLVLDAQSIATVIEFLAKNNLFEDFCVLLLNDEALAASLFGTSDKNITIDPQSILEVDKSHIPRCLEIAQTCVSDKGPMRLRYRERYLLEGLGCYLCSPGVETTSEKC